MTERFSRALAVAGLIAISAALLLGAVPGPDNGFRDLKWGDRPKRDMSRLGISAGMEQYVRHDEDKRVAGADASMIVYSFRQKRLCRVRITWLVAESDKSSIARVLKREWGMHEDIPLALMVGRKEQLEAGDRGAEEIRRMNAELIRDGADKNADVLAYNARMLEAIDRQKNRRAQDNDEFKEWLSSDKKTVALLSSPDYWRRGSETPGDTERKFVWGCLFTTDSA